MKETEISWYSINQHLALEDHEPIELDEALAIADRYLANGTKKLTGAEEAIAATMFGFSRSKSTFIEFCVNGSGQISFRIEISEPPTSWLRKLFKSVFRRKEELGSREDIVRKIQEFFATPAQELQRRLTAQSQAI